MNIAALQAAILAVAPIEGVSVGDPVDKATWRIDFQAAATAQQRTDAQAALLAFVDPPPPTAGDLAVAQAASNDFMRACVKLFAAQSVNIFGVSRTVPQVIAILKALA